MIDFSTIKSFDRRREDTLAAMWHILNIWEWPTQLGPKQVLDSNETYELMRMIEVVIGKRRILDVLRKNR